jgi:hypothetical protein
VTAGIESSSTEAIVSEGEVKDVNASRVVPGGAVHKVLVLR